MFCLALGMIVRMPMLRSSLHPDLIDGIQGFFLGMAIVLNFFAIRMKCRPA